MHYLFSSLQTSTRRLFSVILVISLCLSPILATCTKDADCPFKRCDRERKECRCGMECASNNYQDHVICSRRTCERNGNGTDGCTFRSVCQEFAEECSSRTAFRFILLLANETDRDIFDGDCSTILYGSSFNSKDRLCKHQSYCSNNGICVQDARTKIRTCICDDRHDGPRCDNIKPSANSVRQSTRRKPIHHKSFNGGNAPAPASSSMLLTVLAIASPCMLIGIIFIKRRRPLSESLTTARNIDIDTETTEQRADRNIPAKIVCELVNNKHDFDDCLKRFLLTENSPVEAHSKDSSAVVNL